MKRTLREIFLLAFFLLLMIATVRSNDGAHSAHDLMIFITALILKAGLITAAFAPFVFLAHRLEARIFRR